MLGEPGRAHSLLPAGSRTAATCSQTRDSNKGNNGGSAGTQATRERQDSGITDTYIHMHTRQPPGPRQVGVTVLLTTGQRALDRQRGSPGALRGGCSPPLPSPPLRSWGPQWPQRGRSWGQGGGSIHELVSAARWSVTVLETARRGPWLAPGSCCPQGVLSIHSLARSLAGRLAAPGHPARAQQEQELELVHAQPAPNSGPEG